jgi:hypothetical protein
MANAAMEARRSGIEFVFIVLGIFHFHAIFVFWVAVRPGLPRPRATLSLATGRFSGESSHPSKGGVRHTAPVTGDADDKNASGL